MQLTFLTAALALAAGTSAGTFSLQQKDTDIRSGCDLKIDQICGCSVTLSVHQTLGYDKLPKFWTHGEACGGKWQSNAENPLHTVRFEKAECAYGCNLPSMKALDPDDPLSKHRGQGPKCDGISYRTKGMTLNGAHKPWKGTGH